MEYWNIKPIIRKKKTTTKKKKKKQLVTGDWSQYRACCTGSNGGGGDCFFCVFFSKKVYFGYLLELPICKALLSFHNMCSGSTKVTKHTLFTQNIGTHSSLPYLSKNLSKITLLPVDVSKNTV